MNKRHPFLRDWIVSDLISPRRRSTYKEYGWCFARRLPKQWLNILLKLFRENNSLNDLMDQPLFVNHHSNRKGFAFIKNCLRPFLSQDDRVVDLDTFRELAHFSQLFRRVCDADNLKTRVSVITLPSDQVWRLGPTGRAPGCPKIEEHDLALIIAQTHCAPLDVLHSQSRRRFALLAHDERRKGNQKHRRYYCLFHLSSSENQPRRNEEHEGFF